MRNLFAWSALLLLLITGCTPNIYRTAAPLTVTNELSSADAGRKMEIVVSTEGFERVRHSAQLNALFYLEPETNANELLAIALRRVLLRDKKVHVFRQSDAHKRRYRINLHMTELTPNADTSQSGGELVNQAVLPLYAVVQHLKILTGFSFGSDVKTRSSVLAFDIQLIDPNGTIVYSKPYKAAFQSKITGSGGLASLSDSISFASSSGVDATKFIAEKIATDIYEALNLAVGQPPAS
jgi:hypothetical protein